MRQDDAVAKYARMLAGEHSGGAYWHSPFQVASIAVTKEFLSYFYPKDLPSIVLVELTLREELPRIHTLRRLCGANAAGIFYDDQTSDRPSYVDVLIPWHAIKALTLHHLEA